MPDPQVTPHGGGGPVVAGNERLAGQAFRFTVFAPEKKCRMRLRLG